MDEFGEQLKSGLLPAVLYADDTLASDEMRGLLDAHGVAYETADAVAEGWGGNPCLIVDGVFLGLQDVRHVLTL